jgi:type VI secretion system protein VasJ
VLAECSALLRRLPDLLELRFANGLPVAGSATRSWIESEVLPAGEGGGGGSRGDDPRAEILREAHKLASRNKWPQAMGIYRDQLAAIGPGRERFLLKLAQAKLCQESGKPEYALPILAELDEAVRENRLEKWEPALAIEVIRVYLECQANANRGGTPDLDVVPDLLQRLARLDMVSFLQVDGKF